MSHDSGELETDVKVLATSDPLKTFGEMWYQIFLWALFSSIFVHVIAAAVAFATLRKHVYGKFFPIFILVMGVLAPLTSGVVSSAAVAFVYRASNYQMAPLYALLWGVGQTVLSACIGFTRILATL
ncbi:transmembrane protein 170A [Anabrus simplex]|uniref:transmembrane protein 170A n=1 Tax=Anabrus simplex TaxID=316456 RepID=UPI0034DD7985